MKTDTTTATYRFLRSERRWATVEKFALWATRVAFFALAVGFIAGVTVLWLVDNDTSIIETGMHGQ